MKNAIGLWKCECCNFSNPDDFDRCSYCGLPKTHTLEQLQKYQQVLPEIKSRDLNVWKSLFSTIMIFVFRDNLKLTLILVIGLMTFMPVVKENLLIAIPVAMVAIIFVWGYLKKNT